MLVILNDTQKSNLLIRLYTSEISHKPLICEHPLLWNRVYLQYCSHTDHFYSWSFQNWHFSTCLSSWVSILFFEFSSATESAGDVMISCKSLGCVVFFYFVCQHFFTWPYMLVSPGVNIAKGNRILMNLIEIFMLFVFLFSLHWHQLKRGT